MIQILVWTWLVPVTRAMDKWIFPGCLKSKQSRMMEDSLACNSSSPSSHREADMSAKTDSAP